MIDKQKYIEQRDNAKRRKIKFNFTFEEWQCWWESTGHFRKRGCKKGQYVMARFNDTGPYQVGNVKCILHSENRSESKHTKESKIKISVAKIGEKHPGAKLTEKDILAIRKDKRIGRKIAVDYGVSRTQINRIKRKANWSHI